MNRTILRKFLPVILGGIGGILAVVAARRVVASPAAMLPTVGDPAPDFSLPDENGNMHQLSDYKGRALLIAFYPADFSPGCSIQAHTLSSRYKELVAAGLTPVGVSVQGEASHKSFCKSFSIPYPVLSDTKKVMAKDYGVLNAGLLGGFANRVTFIVSKSGKIAYVDPDVDRHLLTCAQDWITWATEHPAELE